MATIAVTVAMPTRHSNKIETQKSVCTGSRRDRTVGIDDAGERGIARWASVARACAWPRIAMRSAEGA